MQKPEIPIYRIEKSYPDKFLEICRGKLFDYCRVNLYHMGKSVCDFSAKKYTFL